MTARIPFTGSYSLDDVEFLLKPIDIEDTPIHVKEALIQSGQKHYSQMLSHESLPSEDYLSLFYQAMRLNQSQLAQHALILAKRIVATRPHGITLVSLARAGTPVGVLLKQLLKRYHHLDTRHYSVSIIRDVGLDLNALRHILQQHGPETLVFIDGWTGKGVIARQLADSLAVFADSDDIVIPPELYVLTDLSGNAAVAASSDDYLIPSCILNATVSGLISRTVYNPAQAAAGDFHGCVFYRQFAEHDLSGYFINSILSAADELRRQGCDHNLDYSPHTQTAQQLQAQSQQFLQQLQQHYQVSQPNYIKPGIGEATRVLLRREARLLLLKDINSDTTRHLRWLAQSRQVPIAALADLPYQAAALIKEIQ